MNETMAPVCSTHSGMCCSTAAGIPTIATWIAPPSASRRMPFIRQQRRQSESHSGCTWLVEDGVSYAEIGKMAGDTAETIERIYGHHSPAFLKRAADTLQLENRA